MFLFSFFLVMPFLKEFRFSIVSYRVRSDRNNATLLYGCMQNYKNPLNVFLDFHCLESGRRWEQGFLKALKESKAVILLISEQALQQCYTKPEKPDNMLLEVNLTCSFGM